MDIKTKQSVLTKYHIDPDTKKPTSVPVVEKQQVHPLKNLIQMVGEVKKNKKIQIIDRDMIPVNKPEKITQPYHYYVDYEQNLIHFHPDIAGQTIEYKYEDMGVTVISANKIFTKQDEKGNVVELLEDIINMGREAIDVMLTIGGVAIIMKRLEDDIKEGYEVSDKIQADIQQAKDEILNVRGNKEVIIKSSDWTLNSWVSGGYTYKTYEKEITHDLNSENLHVTAKNSDTKEAVTIGYKILDKTRILLKSDEAINMSVILSASYYHATQTISDNIAEEVVKARKGKIDLKTKIDDIDSQLDNIAIDVQSLGFKEGTNSNKDLNTKLIQSLIDNYNDLVLYFPSGINRLGHLNLGTDKNITFRGKSSSFATSVNKSVTNPRIIDTYTRIVVDDENEYWLEHDNCSIIFDKISVLNCKISEDNIITPLKNMTMIKTNSNSTKGKVFASESSFIGWKILSGDRDVLTKSEDLLHSCWLASRCRFTQNEVALSQLVDSRIIDCSFNKNDYGIMLKGNCGFSTIVNNRLEWNINNGIYVYGTHDVTINNNEFDRNSLAGCYIDGMRNGSLIGNVFRRNGALGTLESDNYEENVHYVVKNCDNVKVKNNTTRAMSTLDTSTGGKRRPSNVCKVVDNNHLIFKDNDLLGCTKSNKLEASKIENNINSIIDNLTDFSTTNKTKLPEIHFMNGSNDEDATLIKCSNGINVLIDCGDESTGNWLCDRLNKLGVTKLDYLFITHSHSDHVGGAVAVIERMKPSILYYKDITWELPSVETSWKTQEYHQKMIDKAKEIGVKLVKLTQLTTLNITDKEYFTFYNASIYSDLSDYNMNSLMIGYDYLGTKVLIQSDCLSEVANNKYNGQIGKVDLLKMVHHGGKDKTSKSWLNELRPDYTYYSHEDNDNLEYYKALTLTKLFTRDYNSHHSGCFIITSCGVTPTSTVKENKLANKIISFENKNCYVDNCGEVVENGFIECNGGMYYVRDWYIDKTGSYGDWIYVDDDSYCLYADGSFVRNEWVKSKVSNAWYYCSANGRPYKNTTTIIGTESVTFDENGKANKNFD